MWEAVMTSGDEARVLAWATEWRADGLNSKEVYVSGERIVVVAHFADPAMAERATLTPPPGTLARDGHAWLFERVG